MSAEFGGAVAIEDGGELLNQIEDIRIRNYADWSVEYELLDGAVLRLLYGKMKGGDGSSAVFAQRFAQLYSYVFQRYVKGREILSAEQKGHLASVLIEVEKSYISEALGMSQSVIKKSIERESYMTLLQEHSRLLGDKTRAGQLGLRFEFDYGDGQDGERLIAPVTLSNPPEKEAVG